MCIASSLFYLTYVRACYNKEITQVVKIPPKYTNAHIKDEFMRTQMILTLPATAEKNRLKMGLKNSFIFHHN